MKEREGPPTATSFLEKSMKRTKLGEQIKRERERERKKKEVFLFFFVFFCSSVNILRLARWLQTELRPTECNSQRPDLFIIQCRGQAVDSIAVVTRKGQEAERERERERDRERSK